MLYRLITAFCFLLFATATHAQQVTATIDSVFKSPYLSSSFYLKTTIRNNTTDTLLINKTELTDCHILTCTEDMDEGNEFLYIENWYNTIDSIDTRLINYGNASDLLSKNQIKRLWARDKDIQQANDKMPFVKLGTKEYFVLAPAAKLNLVLFRCLQPDDMIHIRSHLSDEQKRSLKMAVNLVVFYYKAGDDLKKNLFIEDVQKLKLYLTK